MTDARSAQAAHAYLTLLEAALDGVDATTRNEIVAGVREELDGLDAATTAERIRALGDPEFIAAEARGALTVEGHSVSALGKREPSWFAVVAGLLVMIGGFVIPALGAVAGYVMMWFSTAWTRRQKVIATAAPAVAIVVLLGTIALLQVLWPMPAGTPGNGPNPLVPAPYDVVTSTMLLLAIVQIGVGIWLLVAARRGRMRRAG